MSIGTTSQPAIPPVTVDRVLAVGAAATCAGLLAFKLALATRLNVNWDEFYYLNFVHAAARGEFDLLLQGAHVHLFAWLPLVGGDEITQIVAARLVMTALLCLTVVLIWMLGRLWLTGSAAVIPPFVYLASVPVMHHGGSFRADSMLTPLTIAALVLLVTPGRHGRREWYAGMLLGAAFAVTIKLVLFAPLIAALLLFRSTAHPAATAGGANTRLAAGLTVATVTCGTAAVLLFLHSLTISATNVDSVAVLGAGAARKTLLDVPWFVQAGYLHGYVRWQPLLWLLMALGTAMAMVKRRFDLACLALSLLPVAVYRNAFPYYYVVMLAPTCVLAGYAVQELMALVRRRTGPGVAAALVVTIWVGLLYQGLTQAARLSQDGQAIQRRLIAGVHQIFSAPVSYVDRCGMVSSFRKVNFFMSTWGLETYRSSGVPFMPAAVREHQPAFVIVNSWAMDPAQRRPDGLLAEDYELIDRLYPPYWGPLRVAGASADLSQEDETRLNVPFAADYRVASPARVLIDDVLRQAGDVVHVPTEGVRVRPADPQAQDGLRVTLFLAAARPPPDGGFPPLPLFTGL